MNMLESAKKIDLDKYIGLWYQIASFPAWFQRGCNDVTATYRKVDAYIDALGIEKKEYIHVFNSCMTKFGMNNAFGKAYPETENSLKVSFFPLVSADYIIEFVGILNGNYEYAIVGSQEKKYLWILSRKKDVKPSIYKELVSIAKRKGYDVSRLVEG